MQGITILAERQIDVTGFNLNVFVGFIIGFFIVGIIVGIPISIENTVGIKERIAYCLVFATLITGIGFALGFLFASIVPVGKETIYDVLIDNDVSMTEFLKHYEIIEQDGLIFTVREI